MGGEGKDVIHLQRGRWPRVKTNSRDLQGQGRSESPNKSLKSSKGGEKRLRGRAAKKKFKGQIKTIPTGIKKKWTSRAPREKVKKTLERGSSR